MTFLQTVRAAGLRAVAAGVPEGGRHRLTPLLVLAAVVLLAGSVSAAPAHAANALENIGFTALPGGEVQVVLTLAKPAPQPVGFSTERPARIALDLPDTRNALAHKTQPIGVGVARSITTAQAEGRTRVVLNLAKLVPYDVRVAGNRIYVTLNGAPAQGAAGATASVSSVAARAAQPGITGVDFRRGAAGQALITVHLANSSVSWNLHAEGKKIYVDFMNANLPARLEQRLDVTDFATPVTHVDTYVRGNGARMAIAAHGQYEDMAYQAGDKLTIEVKPVTAAQKEARAKAKFKYTGQRLSLNFQNIQTRAVLQLIADFTGLNIVVSDSVKGNLTLRLKNVPWDQALDIILQTQGLGMRRSGNVIWVAPGDEIAAREKLEAETQKQLQKLEPLRSEFIQVNYAKASDIAKLLQSGQDSKSGGFLSSRGSVTVDARTNTLLVQDTPSRLGEIRKLVRTLDIPVRQVLIESRVVIANNDWSRDLGTKFGFSRATTFGSNGSQYAVGGTLPGAFKPPGGVTAFEEPAGSGTEGLISSLPVVNPTAALGIVVGRIGSHLLQLELSSMQAEGRGEVVSSPRVITANDMTATIEQGVEIPYQQATSSGATSVQFKKAVLSLKVTPHITPDNRIIMDLEVNKDSVGQVFFGVPSIDTNNVQTQVLVDNGETVVLGGIYQHTDKRQKNSIPILGDIPGLGFLFRNTQKTNNRSELLVFVTPKIMKDVLRVDQARSSIVGGTR